MAITATKKENSILISRQPSSIPGCRSMDCTSGVWFCEIRGEQFHPVIRLEVVHEYTIAM